MADLDTRVAAMLSELLADSGPIARRLGRALRLLAKWRSVLIQEAMIRECGLAVQSGPFAGMEFVARSAEGCHVPKLLGCYESALHPHIDALADRGYATILNVGSAEGYYAVGLARLLPDARVVAFDSNAGARETLRPLAQKNGVAGRIEIHGRLHGETLADHARGRTLLVCDIEGDESALLDPDRFPVLRNMDIIVELHDVFDASISRVVASRFADTHDIVRIESTALPALPAALRRWDELDRLLAVWEWRGGPTPWAVMRAKELLAP